MMKCAQEEDYEGIIQAILELEDVLFWPSRQQTTPVLAELPVFKGVRRAQNQKYINKNAIKQQNPSKT